MNGDETLWASAPRRENLCDLGFLSRITIELLLETHFSRLQLTSMTVIEHNSLIHERTIIEGQRFERSEICKS